MGTGVVVILSFYHCIGDRKLINTPDECAECYRKNKNDIITYGIVDGRHVGADRSIHLFFWIRRCCDGSFGGHRHALARSPISSEDCAILILA